MGRILLFPELVGATLEGQVPDII